jgi:CDP-diacylglycerol--glycerol-3-phosphate 3-phosphatidyltransferase
VARLLLRFGIGPDAVTVVGTLGVCVGALVFFPRGRLVWGSVVIAVFALADVLDGIMARRVPPTGTWGAFLDSTADRLGDAAVFSGLVLYFAGRRNDIPMAALCLSCLVAAGMVAQVRAQLAGGRRLGLGRADGLLVLLAGTASVGLGAPQALLGLVLAGFAGVCLVIVVRHGILAFRLGLPAAVRGSGLGVAVDGADRVDV